MMAPRRWLRSLLLLVACAVLSSPTCSTASPIAQLQQRVVQAGTLEGRLLRRTQSAAPAASSSSSAAAQAAPTRRALLQTESILEQQTYEHATFNRVGGDDSEEQEFALDFVDEFWIVPAPLLSDSSSGATTVLAATESSLPLRWIQLDIAVDSRQLQGWDILQLWSGDALLRGNLIKQWTGKLLQPDVQVSDALLQLTGAWGDDGDEHNPNDDAEMRHPDEELVGPDPQQRIRGGIRDHVDIFHRTVTFRLHRSNISTSSSTAAAIAAADATADAAALTMPLFTANWSLSAPCPNPWDLAFDNEDNCDVDHSRLAGSPYLLLIVGIPGLALIMAVLFLMGPRRWRRRSGCPPCCFGYVGYKERTIMREHVCELMKEAHSRRNSLKHPPPLPLLLQPQHFHNHALAIAAANAAMKASKASSTGTAGNTSVATATDHAASHCWVAPEHHKGIATPIAHRPLELHELHPNDLHKVVAQHHNQQHQHHHQHGASEEMDPATAATIVAAVAAVTAATTTAAAGTAHPAASSSSSPPQHPSTPQYPSPQPQPPQPQQHDNALAAASGAAGAGTEAPASSSAAAAASAAAPAEPWVILHGGPEFFYTGAAAAELIRQGNPNIAHTEPNIDAAAAAAAAAAHATSNGNGNANTQANAVTISTATTTTRQQQPAPLHPASALAGRRPHPPLKASCSSCGGCEDEAAAVAAAAAALASGSKSPRKNPDGSWASVGPVEHEWSRRIHREIIRTYLIFLFELSGTIVNWVFAVQYIDRSQDAGNSLLDDQLALAYLSFGILATIGCLVNAWSRIVVIKELRVELVAAQCMPLSHSVRNHRRVAPGIEIAFLERKVHHLKVVALTLMVESLPFAMLGFSKLYRYNLVQSNFILLGSCAVSAFWVGSKITRLIVIPELLGHIHRLEDEEREEAGEVRAAQAKKERRERLPGATLEKAILGDEEDDEVANHAEEAEVEGTRSRPEVSLHSRSFIRDFSPVAAELGEEEFEDVDVEGDGMVAMRRVKKKKRTAPAASASASAAPAADERDSQSAAKQPEQQDATENSTGPRFHEAETSRSDRL